MARSTGPCGLLLPLLTLSSNPFLLVLLTHWALPPSLRTQPGGLLCPASLAVFLPPGPTSELPSMLPIHCCFIGSRPNSAWVPPHIPRFPFSCSSSKRHLPDKEHHQSPWHHSCIFGPLGLHPRLSLCLGLFPGPWSLHSSLLSPSSQAASTKGRSSSRDLILLSLLPALNWSLGSGHLYHLQVPQGKAWGGPRNAWHSALPTPCSQALPRGRHVGLRGQDRAGAGPAEALLCAQSKGARSDC